MDNQWEQLDLYTAIAQAEADAGPNCGMCGWPVNEPGARDAYGDLMEACDVVDCPQSTGPTTTATR